MTPAPALTTSLPDPHLCTHTSCLHRCPCMSQACYADSNSYLHHLLAPLPLASPQVREPSLYVVHVAVEMAPIAKVRAKVSSKCGRKMWERCRNSAAMPVPMTDWPSATCGLVQLAGLVGRGPLSIPAICVIFVSSCDSCLPAVCFLTVLHLCCT